MPINALTAGVAALAINSTAFTIEIFRGGFAAVPVAATEIADAPTMFHGGGEAIEHVPVEHLAVELLEVLLGVLFRDRVVARHDAVAPARR